MEQTIIASDVIEFRGHPNILATHRNTIEVTTDPHISRRADCIVGVDATKGCENLSESLKRHIQRSGQLSIVIAVGDLKFSFSGRGRSELELSDSRELVLRKSDFVSARTAAVFCNAAAIDIPRKMIEKLQDPDAIGMLTLTTVEEFASSPVMTVESSIAQL